LFVGVEGFTSAEDQDQLQRIEKQIRRRFVVGSQVSENAIIQDLVKQVSFFPPRFYNISF
jgi:DNA replication licensing factor MCM5